MKRSDSGFWTVVSLSTIAFLVVLFVAFGRGCWVGESVAQTALDKAGYTDIEITDHAWFIVGLRGCSTSDAARFTATAKNNNGKEVSLTVCSGWILKDATIRF
jgi:hypothetical protein